MSNKLADHHKFIKFIHQKYVIHLFFKNISLKKIIVRFEI